MEKRLTVIEMAEYLGVSKEAIYNRVRRGSLKSIIEDGKKYVLLTEDLKKEGKRPKRTAITATHESEYINLLKDQLEELKAKNLKLEEDKERLLRDKEAMLIESKEKIEQIYKDRDEQLKTILRLANVPRLEQSTNKSIKEESEVVEEVELEEEGDIVEQMCESFEEWHELRAFLDSKGYSKEDRKEIKKKIKKKIGKDTNVKTSLAGDIYIKKDTKLKEIIGKFKS